MPRDSGDNGLGIICRQQPQHPGMTIAPPVERWVERRVAERIRGGCCVCPGGSVWVFTATLEGDEVKAEVQRAQQQEVEGIGLPGAGPSSLPQSQSPEMGELEKMKRAVEVQEMAQPQRSRQPRQPRQPRPQQPQQLQQLQQPAPSQGAPQLPPLQLMLTPLTTWLTQHLPSALRTATSLPTGSQQREIPQTSKPGRRASMSAVPDQAPPSVAPSHPQEHVLRQTTQSTPTSPTTLH